jgi:hypothetical protein
MSITPVSRLPPARDTYAGVHFRDQITLLSESTWNYLVSAARP